MVAVVKTLNNHSGLGSNPNKDDRLFAWWVDDHKPIEEQWVWESGARRGDPLGKCGPHVWWTVEHQ